MKLAGCIAIVNFLELRKDCNFVADSLVVDSLAVDILAVGSFAVGSFAVDNY